MSYGPKIDMIVDGMIAIKAGDMTEKDWRDLAMAALDQGGMSVADQATVRALFPVGECVDCMSTDEAHVNPDHDDEKRCGSCAADKERQVERLRGGDPDREHIAAMRQRHYGVES